LWEPLPAGEHLALVIGQAGSSLIHAKLYFLRRGGEKERRVGVDGNKWVSEGGVYFKGLVKQL
jgi:hypothetical protein